MQKKVQNDLRFLVHVARFVYTKYNPYCFILYMILNYCALLKQKRTFNLRGVNKNYLLSSLGAHNVLDINNTIIINEGVLKTQQPFVIIEVELENKLYRRKAQIISKKLQDDVEIILSHNLLHNLKCAQKCRLKECKDSNFEFADEVELALINTPNDWGNFVVDEVLKSYFKKPKLVSKGDVIGINLGHHGKEVFYNTSKIISSARNIYFKCNKVIYKDKNVSNIYFCTVGKTTVRQITNIQCFIPQYCQQDGFDNVSICPNGLQTYFAAIKKAIEPFIVKKNIVSRFKPLFLLEGRKGCGKSNLVKCVASYFGMHLAEINNFDLTANIYAQNETKLRNALFNAKMAAPVVIEFTNFENFGKNNEGQYDERLINHFTDELTHLFQNNDFPVVLFCCSNEKNIPVELKRVFLKIFEIKAPNEQEREHLLSWIIQCENIKSNVSLKDISNKTHGFLLEDLRALVHHAVSDLNRENNTLGKTQIAEANLLTALDFMQSMYNESLGAPKIPKVKWSDVGGLSDVKDEIIKTIKLPLQHPELVKATGLKRSGILLFGPPGTGKTLLAKAVATECGLCFLSVKGPELLNMYVGQSEQNVREVFERAREASPCIIFFDELDSLAPNRGASGDSGGVMDRVVSQFLAEMDGLNDSGTIFIFGATNRPDLIDPALLRPGRFDKLLYVGPCIDRASKISVLKALTSKFNLEEECVVDKTVDSCPENFSGADFYGICSNAWISAVRRLISSVEKGSEKNGYDATVRDVIVTLHDFQYAIKGIKPSIKQEDLEYFRKFQTDQC